MAKAHQKKAKGPREATPPIEGSYPASYAGKWIAWTPDGRTIVASAKTLQGVRRQATRAGHDQVILERVPRNWEPVLGEPAS